MSLESKLKRPERYQLIWAGQGKKMEVGGGSDIVAGIAFRG